MTLSETKIQPTPEQLAVIEHGVNSPRNLLVEARAGAAKTSTLVMLAEALPQARGLALAFNVSIKEEMSSRLPDSFECKTMNGLGHGAVMRLTGKRLKLNKSKSYGLLKEAIEALSDKKERDIAFEEMPQTLKMISSAKQIGFVHGIKKTPSIRPILDEEEFLERLEEIPTDLQLDLIREVTFASFRLALDQGIIDFDDQILLPALCSVSFPFYTHVLVDEAQDLSNLQHIILKKLVRAKTKLIAVGDPCQAIYAFRGADEDSMPNLKQKFDMDTLYLTTCFRCPSAVIEEARWRAPDMQWPSWAAAGEVRTLTAWTPEDVPDGSAILCRNNAPLFRTALRLIRAKRYPEIMGRDILQNIANKMKKLGPEELEEATALRAVTGWVNVEKERTKNQSLIEDTAECMRIFITGAGTLGAGIAAVLDLANRSGRIKLGTGHRAKGLEFEQVFFLDAQLCRPKGQDRNIKYVIQTRAQSRLTYVTSDTFLEQEVA